MRLLMSETGEEAPAEGERAEERAEESRRCGSGEVNSVQQLRILAKDMFVVRIPAAHFIRGLRWREDVLDQHPRPYSNANH